MSETAKNRKPYTIHKTEILLNKDKLKSITDNRGLEFKQVFQKAKDKYGLDLSYKGFMSLISNRATWKLLYAWAILDVLEVQLLDIFDVVHVNREEKIKEKEEWNRLYGGNKKDG